MTKPRTAGSRRGRGRGDCRGYERSSAAGIGKAEGINKTYVSRMLRLAALAPDLVEAILAGRTDQSVMLEQLERPLPASWTEQRRHPELA
jgi:hypothetical protein